MTRTQVPMKGTVRAAFAISNCVHVWVSSPTGDSSDSHNLLIPCLSHEQAAVIAETWREVWGL